VPTVPNTRPTALDDSPPNGTDVLSPTSLINYTIRADAGLGFIDVLNHKSDFERRILPLQWAVDSVRNFPDLAFLFSRFYDTLTRLPILLDG
jgi:hypothetical protein